MVTRSLTVTTTWLPGILFLVLLLSNCQNANPNQQQDLVKCLVYHRFGNDQYPSTNIGKKLFKKQLKYLKQHDFTVLTLGEAARRKEKGTLTNGPYAVITVDDGYKSFKSGAMPLLKKYGFPATLFVNTDAVGGSAYLNWDDLKALQKQGIEIGNHSHSHAHFLNIKDKEARKEQFKADLKTAQKAFKAHLGTKPEVYAYPYGEYSPSMYKVLDQQGIRVAAAQHSGVWGRYTDPYAIPRFPMTGNFGRFEAFKNKVRMQELPVKQERPNQALFQTNPPTLEVLIDTAIIHTNRLQCFIDGRRDLCDFSVDTVDKGYKVKLTATDSLKNRRTKYTLTAPGKAQGQWHWYSKLWVNPAVSE